MQICAGLRYVRYSPALRNVLIRSGIVMFFASGLLALLPAVAHYANPSPTAYGLLLGCFGAGAILRSARNPEGSNTLVCRGCALQWNRNFRNIMRGGGYYSIFASPRSRCSGSRWRMDRVCIAFQCGRTDSHTRLGTVSGTRSLNARLSRSYGGRQCHIGALWLLSQASMLLSSMPDWEQ